MNEVNETGETGEKPDITGTVTFDEKGNATCHIDPCELSIRPPFNIRTSYKTHMPDSFTEDMRKVALKVADNAFKRELDRVLQEAVRHMHSKNKRREPESEPAPAPVDKKSKKQLKKQLRNRIKELSHRLKQ